MIHRIKLKFNALLICFLVFFFFYVWFYHKLKTTIYMRNKLNLSAIIVLFLTVLNINSCSNNIDTLNETETSEIFEEKVIDKFEDLISNYKNINLSQNKVNISNEINILDTLRVDDERLKNPIYLAAINENLSIENKYEVKSTLLYYDLNHIDKEIGLSFIIRTFKNKEIHVTEFVSILTGEIMSFHLENINDIDYKELRKYYYNENYFQNKLSDDTIVCFATFDDCFNHMNGSGSSQGQAICDFLPCNAISYVACFILEQEGFVATSDCFMGCQACDLFIEN